MLSSSAGQRLSHDVVVVEPPQLVVYPEQENITVVEGSRLQMDCHLNRTEGNVTWLYHNKSEPSQAYSAHMSISPVRRTDAGNYTCVGVNGFRNNTPVTVTKRVEVDCKSE